jgi:predicted metal-dependent peptidase
MNQNQRAIFEETMINSLVDPQYVFYAHVIASTKVNFDEKFPAPAGVSFQKNQFNLHINPTTFNAFTLQERKGVLVHEAMHIILRHIGRFRNRNRKIANMAADIAINQFIKDLPENCLYHTTFGLEEKLSMENYYSLLYKKAEKINFTQNPDGSVSFEYKGKKYTIDPHAGDDMSDGEVPQEIIDGIAEEITKKSMEKSRGLIPSDLQEMLDKLMSKKVNWKKYIKNEMSNAAIDIEETIKRRNRRFLKRIEIKGFVQKFSSEGVVILDTSGSVDSSFISKTLGEINNLASSTGAEVTLIQVDAEVQQIKKFDHNSKKIGIKGRGGTHLYPAIEEIKNKKIRHDWIVVITDGEIESSWPVPPKCKVFFLMPTKARLNLDVSNIKSKIFNIEYDK